MPLEAKYWLTTSFSTDDAKYGESQDCTNGKETSLVCELASVHVNALLRMPRHHKTSPGLASGIGLQCLS